MKSRLSRLLLGLLLLSSLAAPPAAAQAPPPPPPPEAAAEPIPHGEDHGHVHGIHPEPGVTAGEGGAASLPAEAAGASPRQVFGLDFMQRALWAGLLVGGVCAYLGVYVVLRRIVFVGVALSEMSSAGVALSLLMNFSPMLGSVGLMLAGVGLFSVQWAPRKVRQDAFIGIGYVVASALAILLIAKSAQGEGHLLALLFGNILTVTTQDVLATALALGGVLLVHLLFAKELLFVSFDPDTAQAAGYHARFWEALLYVTIGLTIAFAIHAVGVLMTFAALVLPAVTSLLLTRRMPAALLGSVLAGLLPVPVGLYLSFVWDLPSAATIVGAGFALLLAGGLVSRLRAA